MLTMNLIAASAAMVLHTAPSQNVHPEGLLGRRRSSAPLMDSGLEDYDYEYVLSFASRVAREAGAFLVDPSSPPDSVVADAVQHLNFELAHEPAVSIGAKWVSHVDDKIISVALVDSVHGPLLGAVCRPATGELLSAALNSGAFVQHGDGPPTTAPELGCVSMYANVVHVPHDRCPELDLALEGLEEKMPVNVTRVPCCCCCEGLFEVVSGRADAHLSPPERCYLGQQLTPVAVLCAFSVLLEETGGVMTDVLGNDIDLLASSHSGGVLASEAASHNYFLHSVRSPFEAEPLLLPRLADKLSSNALGFTVEYVGGSERIVQDSADADAAWTWGSLDLGSLDGFPEEEEEM